MENLFNGIYNGKSVFVTGHTGFKGSWLCMWLSKLGARVSGYSLTPPTDPAHVNLLEIPMSSRVGDIRDSATLTEAMKAAQPDIVFHLAAQPLVRESYKDPCGTYTTNVIGTQNVCESCREVTSVKAMVGITTDKVYRNREWQWPYREVDELGGHDPYSSSKACAEILLSSYRNSFFAQNSNANAIPLLLASARAGNVIGGGDWAKDRLIPDIVKAAAEKKIVPIRFPRAVRPWQHVLECLRGYLTLGQHLLSGDIHCADAFNFGPSQEGELTVEQIVLQASSL